MSELASYPKSMQKLVRELTKLPSIGEKSALRLAYHLLSNSPSQIDSLATALKEAKDQIRFCSRCFFFSESEICGICENVSRDDGLLCVVE
ncbi:MAG: recombination protein RecR, partial [Bdellovibrionales bacterium]|nr:recombination protein RecR [Bdellovibrionales bacterium]